MPLESNSETPAFKEKQLVENDPQDANKKNYQVEWSDLTKKSAENAQQLKAVTEVKQVAGKTWWRADQAMTISTVVLGFGVLILILAALLLKKTVITTESILRIFGTITIIIGAIFLVVAGYTTEQIGPVMGLLGTIAGYLLGKSNNTIQTPAINSNES